MCTLSLKPRVFLLRSPSRSRPWTFYFEPLLQLLRISCLSRLGARVLARRVRRTISARRSIDVWALVRMEPGSEEIALAGSPCASTFT